MNIIENKSLDIRKRIDYELKGMNSVFDTSGVKTGRPNAISSYYNLNSVSCKRAVACANILDDRKTICFALKLGLQLCKRSIETQKQFYLSDFYNFFFYSLISSNEQNILFAATSLVTCDPSLKEATWGPVHACLGFFILRDAKKSSEWLAVVNKQCARKKNPYPKNTYHAMAALLAKDEDALAASLDEVLLEHHAKANHGSSYDYNHPESFYCYFAVLIALTAKLFCNIDVIDKLKHDKNVLRLRISDYTEGDSVDRKTKYDVPVDYMFFAKLKEQGFLNDLET